MLTDKVRTSTYASFILGTPTVFNDAVVLDVGCGTGILSMFAARSGAKRVYAVDASDIVKRTEKIIKDNGHDDVITYVSHPSFLTKTKKNRITHLLCVCAWGGCICTNEGIKLRLE